MRRYLLLFILCVGSWAFAQNRSNVDSLQNVVKSSASDSLRIKALTFLTYNYLYSKPDSSKYYNDLMFAISKQSNFDLGYYNAYMYKSYLHWSKSEYDSALVAVNKSIEHAEAMKDTAKISSQMQRIAALYNKLGRYDSSEVVTRKAIKLAIQSGDWRAIMGNYGQLGNVFYYQNKFDQALENYLKVDSITSKNPISNSMSAAAAINIGNIFVQFENYEKAKTYFEKGKEFYKILKMEEGMFHADQKLAEIEGYKDNHEKCIALLQPVKAFYTKIGDQSALANIHIVLGESYTQLEDFNAAESAYISALTNAKNSKDMTVLASTHKAAGRTQAKLGKYRFAVDNLQKARRLNREINITVETGTLLADLAGAYKGLKKYDSAFYYLQAHQRFKDTIALREKFEQTKELEEKYQAEQKEQQIKLLSAENDLSQQQKTNQRNLFMAGGSVLALSLIGLFFLYRNKQRTNTQLRALDSMKSNFFANISHEFRTPLTLISGPIQQKLENKKISSKDREAFEMIDRNNNRLLGLVDQLLDLSKIDAGNLYLNVGQGNLTSLLRALTESFSFRAEQNGVSYEINIEEGMNSVCFDKDMIEKIVFNLLSNAFKYVTQNGFVTIKAGENQNEQLVLEVGNSSAKNYDPSKLEHLFDRFYQANTASEGVGIGLALTRELVTLHKGTINVKNNGHGHIVFAVNLPIGKKHFTKNEFRDEKIEDAQRLLPTSSVSNASPEGAIFEENESPILLIVEDNPDLRAFLTSNFEEDYNILTAVNGEEGLQKALEHVPDMIISDIMMPLKNGIVMTETLKKDERTSHIPIILLTAKAGEENELKGIEVGADDYITKPFSNKILNSKVGKLIALRKKLRDRYSQEVILKPKDISVNSVDEQFLQRVQHVLDHSVVESTFNTEEFSKAVNMSRMQLHRKLKALTGLSASEFIRSQRLKLAVELLKESDINVSQVGYSVGFNDHSYFTKCFREMYGMSPSEYIKKRS